LAQDEWTKVKTSLKEATIKYSTDPTVAKKSEAFRKKHGLLSEIDLMKAFTV